MGVHRPPPRVMDRPHPAAATNLTNMATALLLDAAASAAVEQKRGLVRLHQVLHCGCGQGVWGGPGRNAPQQATQPRPQALGDTGGCVRTSTRPV